MACIGKTTGRTSKLEYTSWRGMITRCTIPDDNRYHAYGAKGIKVCDRWLESFENFLEDMGSKPTPKHSIDRIENNKGYYKENCRWATPKEQANNKRNNIKVNHKGTIVTLMQFSEITNTPYKTLWSRIKKRGVDILNIETY